MVSLSETYPPQIILAIYQKWSRESHGINPKEQNFIKYFNTKNLTCLSFNKEDLTYEGIEGCINSFNEITDYTCYMSPVVMYRYKDRDFCIKHNGLEKFQKLWRKFHYQIMPRYKNMRNLQHRILYGKFKQF
jgi:hypothetical protein